MPLLVAAIAATVAGQGVSGENFDDFVQELNSRIESAEADDREWPKFPGGLAGFLFGQDSVIEHGRIYFAAGYGADHDDGGWREASIAKLSDGTWRVTSIRVCEESDISDLIERRDYQRQTAKTRMGFNYADQRPFDLLDLLKRWDSNFWVSPIPPFGWVKESDLPALVELLDSSEPCASVQSMLSSLVDTTRSNVGNEAAYLIEGFRNDRYPPRLNSTRPFCDIEEIRKWWEEREGT